MQFTLADVAATTQRNIWSVVSRGAFQVLLHLLLLESADWRD